MKNFNFGRNPKASYFMTETLIVKKVAYILASLCEGERLPYLFSVLRKISYKLDKNGKKIPLLYLLKKSRAKKYFDITFSLKRSLNKPRKINETMNPIFGLDHEIYEIKLKKNKIFFEKKNDVYFGRKTKASYLMTVTLLAQRVAYIYAVFLERVRFPYLSSV